MIISGEQKTDFGFFKVERIYLFNGCLDRPLTDRLQRFNVSPTGKIDRTINDHVRPWLSGECLTRCARSPPGLIVGFNNASNQFVTYNVTSRERYRYDSFNRPQNVQRFNQTRNLSPKADPPGLGRRWMIILEPSPRRVRNIFICMVVVFCASSESLLRETECVPSYRRGGRFQ